MIPFIRKVVARWQLPFGITNPAALLRNHLTLQYHFPAMKKLGVNDQVLRKFILPSAVAGSLGICAFAYGFSKEIKTNLKKNSHAYLIALATACLLLKRKTHSLASLVVVDMYTNGSEGKPRCYKKKDGDDEEFEEIPISNILPDDEDEQEQVVRVVRGPNAPLSFTGDCLKIVPPFKEDFTVPDDEPKKVKLTSQRVIDPSFPTSSKGTSFSKNFRSTYPGKLPKTTNISTAIYDCETGYVYHLPDGVLSQEYQDKKYSLSSYHSLLQQKETYYQDIYDNAFSKEDLARMTAKKRAMWKRESKLLQDQIKKIHIAAGHALEAFHKE